MGKILYDSTCQNLINNQDETLTEASKLLLKDAYFLAENTDDDIFIALDLNDKRYYNDFSTMVISEIVEDRVHIIDCINEGKYI